MLNPFPDLLTFSLFAPMMVRFALGFYFFWFGFHLLRDIYRGHLEKPGTDLLETQKELEPYGEDKKQVSLLKIKKYSWWDQTVGWVSFISGVSIIAGFLMMEDLVPLMTP